MLKVTNQKSIFYIGHSQGTTVFFILMSEKPEYNSKIRLMNAFGPAAYVAHFSPYYKFITLFHNELNVIN